MTWLEILKNFLIALPELVTAIKEHSQMIADRRAQEVKNAVDAVSVQIKGIKDAEQAAEMARQLSLAQQHTPSK